MANLTEVLSAVRESDQFSQLTEQISAGSGEIQAQVTGPLRAPVIAAVFLATGRGITAVTEGGGQAAQLAGDIAAYLGESKVRQLPDPEVLPFERLSTPPDVVAERARILDDARSGPPFVIVAQVKTLIRRTTPHKRYPAPFDITAGMEADFDGLIEYLVGVGFRRVPVVEARGEFSVRGGIVDLFPGDSDSPIRADFLGNEVDSIREFAVESQESIGALDSVRVYPCREVVIEARDVGLGRSRLGPALDDEVSMDLAAFESGKVFSGAEFYVPYVYETPESVPEALPDDWPSFLCEPGDLRAGADAFLETADDFMRGRLHFTAVNASLEDYFDDFDSLRLRCRTTVSLTRNPADDALFRLKHSPVPSFLGKIDSLEEYLRDGAKTGETTVVTARPGTVARVKERVTKDLAGNDQGMRALAAARFVAGHLSEGHELPAFKLRVVTERDLFGRIVGLPPARRRRDVQSGLRLADIKQGDFVVHRTHGIGRYHQMVQRDMGDGRKDYLELRYGGGDKLFIPLGQIGNVFKYQGAGGAPPLSRLGSAKWSRTKRRVKEALRELAADLFKLYEHRRKAKGFAFSGDTHWQQELEQTFEHAETPDQLRTIDEVKRDMEADRPMDRLVCGDVGYGKTEVALRAAFKAVLDGKQVLVLAPTTILVQQHLATFVDRFAPFPVFVEMLSRFRSHAEQKRIIRQFAAGEVDVLIGTHRLLQPDVVPKDLGLIVVDEEQRFGVSHKERLKELKKAVDVLTLSATPIPRTLEMAFSGLRDLSVIDTPPEDRLPVVTYVGRYDGSLVRQAILRELEREGQVYYVYNRVRSIGKIRRDLERLVPEARIAVAHGQMNEHELESVMSDFGAGRFDVLLCTTIIESGIDLPAVNTMVVESAENLGLAQLYQLRGRIGRGGHRAYAYFFHAKEKVLTDDAGARLRTIGDFTELGSGMRIAMRDLEIRGAGNLLGREQHGHLAAVGFELYCDLLKETVEEIGGHASPSRKRPRIELPIEAYLPRDYIEQDYLRVEAYRQIDGAGSLGDVEEVSERLLDRYGPLPEPAQNVLAVARLGVIGAELGVDSVSVQRGDVLLNGLAVSEATLATLKRQYPQLIRKSSEQVIVIPGASRAPILPFLSKFFDDIIHLVSDSAVAQVDSVKYENP